MVTPKCTCTFEGCDRKHRGIRCYMERLMAENVELRDEVARLKAELESLRPPF